MHLAQAKWLPYRRVPGLSSYPTSDWCLTVWTGPMGPMLVADVTRTETGLNAHEMKDNETLFRTAARGSFTCGSDNGKPDVDGAILANFGCWSPL